MKFLQNHMYDNTVYFQIYQEWLSITPAQTDLYKFVHYKIMQYLLCDHVPVVE